MRKILIFSLLLIAGGVSAQPTIWGGAKMSLIQGDTSFITTAGAFKNYVASYFSGGGTVSTVAVATANGLAGTSDGNAGSPTLTLTTTVNGLVKGNGAAFSAATAGTDYVIPSGSVATLTTPRAIYGNNFDGSAALTQIIASTFGGTGNGFTKFSGPTTAEKTFTLPNVSSTILTSNDLVTVAQGGTGANTLSGVLFGNGTSAFTATALGGDVTLYGSNGTAPLFYTLGITTTSAAIGFARSSGTLNLNIPDADASFRGAVSTGTQTFAGAKTFSGAVTVSGLATASAGANATATSTQAALNAIGVVDGAYRSVTANTTIAETDYLVLVGTLTADITLTLPACNATRDGWEWRFIKKGADAFAFVIDPNAAEVFMDGAATKTFFGQGNGVTCKCENGTGWAVGRF